MKRWAARVGWGLLWVVAGLCLIATVLPFYLDRIYYRGPVSSHFDGQRFFNPDGEDTMLPGKTSRATLLWQQLFGDPTRPVWPERVTVQPSKPAARVFGGAMRVTWVGHATLLVQADGVNILTDPVWSDTVGPFGFGPRRVAAPGIRFEDLPGIDVILVSHNHYDHMDLATLKRIQDRDNALVVTSLGNDSVMAGAGIRATALDWGGVAQVPAACARLARVRDAQGRLPPQCLSMPIAAVHVTRSHHWGSRWFSDRSRALWSSFVVALPHGNFFFAGDTGLGDGKWPAEAAALGPVRFAAIPIGAFRFEDGQQGIGSHIGPWGALQVWNGLGRPRAVPIHWGTFRLSREGYRTPPDLLRAMIACAGGDAGQFMPAAIGVGMDVPPLDAQPKTSAPDMAAVERCRAAGRFDALR